MMIEASEYWMVCILAIAYMLVGVRFAYKFFVYHAHFADAASWDFFDFFIASVFVLFGWPVFITARIIRDEW